jgi:hypothetical protein
LPSCFSSFLDDFGMTVIVSCILFKEGNVAFATAYNYRRIAS